MAENHPVNKMPPKIAAAVISVMTEVEPAQRSQTDAESQRTFSTVDDIFAALQPVMAKHGLICEMMRKKFELVALPGPDGDRSAIMAEYCPRLQVDDEVYYDPENLIDMVAPIEGINTAAAARTIAERTYLRALFKLPTAPNEAINLAMAGQPAGDGSDRIIEAEGHSAASAPGGLRKPRPAFRLGKPESEAECRRIVEAIDKAYAEGAPEAVNDAFRLNQEVYGRLQKIHQSIIESAVSAKLRALAGQAGEAGESEAA